MSYERIDTDTQVQRIQQILNQIQDQPENVPEHTNTGLFLSSGNVGDAAGELTGVKSDTPIVANLTDLDEDGNATGTTDRINLSSSLQIVDYATPLVDIDLRFINFKPPYGSRVKFTPKVNRTLVIKTGGDFDISADITVNDFEYKEFIFLDETQTGITGGGFVPAKDVSGGGGGGEFFGPWTADHNAGGFNLFNLSTLAFDSGLTKGLVMNAGGVGLFAPTGDTIDFFINSLSIPKFGITETSIESNVDLNMNNQDILNWDNLTSLGGDQISDDATLGGLTMFLGSSREFRIFQGVPQVARFGIQIDFFEQVNLNDNNMTELASLLFDEGHSIQGAVSEFGFVTASGDVESHYNNLSKILEINSVGMVMEDSKTITLEDSATADTMQLSQSFGESVINYTGDFIIKEAGTPLITLSGLILGIEREIEMNNNEINNAFSLEIEENFGAGGVPIRPVNGAKLFVREQFSDPSKRELRAYFPSGSSQLVASEP